MLCRSQRMLLSMQPGMLSQPGSSADHWPLLHLLSAVIHWVLPSDVAQPVVLLGSRCRWSGRAPQQEAVLHRCARSAAQLASAAPDRCTIRTRSGHMLIGS